MGFRAISFIWRQIIASIVRWASTTRIKLSYRHIDTQKVIILYFSFHKIHHYFDTPCFVQAKFLFRRQISCNTWY